jgi:hypothetical protein
MPQRQVGKPGQRRERTGLVQPLPGPFGRCADERGLTDTGFAQHRKRPPLRDPLGEERKLTFAPYEHRWIVVPPGNWRTWTMSARPLHENLSAVKTVQCSWGYVGAGETAEALLADIEAPIEGCKGPQPQHCHQPPREGVKP